MHINFFSHFILSLCLLSNILATHETILFGFSISLCLFQKGTSVLAAHNKSPSISDGASPYATDGSETEYLPSTTSPDVSSSSGSDSDNVSCLLNF